MRKFHIIIEETCFTLLNFVVGNVRLRLVYFQKCEIKHYLNVVTAERQTAQKATVKQMHTLIIVAFNRLQLPVAGISDGYANTRIAALFTNCGIIV